MLTVFRNANGNNARGSSPFILSKSKICSVKYYQVGTAEIKRNISLEVSQDGGVVWDYI